MAYLRSGDLAVIPAGTGTVLQTVSDAYATVLTVTTYNFAAFHADFGVTITPAQGNHVLILATLSELTFGDWCWMDIRRDVDPDGSPSATNNISGSTHGLCGQTTSYETPGTYSFLDSGIGTGVPIKYSPTIRDDNPASAITINSFSQQKSNIIVMEIQA